MMHLVEYVFVLTIMLEMVKLDIVMTLMPVSIGHVLIMQLVLINLIHLLILPMVVHVFVMWDSGMIIDWKMKVSLLLDLVQIVYDIFVEISMHVILIHVLHIQSASIFNHQRSILRMVEYVRVMLVMN